MHNHNGSHTDAGSRQALRFALILTASMIAAEAVGGFFANSLALIGDAGHMLVDALSLALSLFALTISSRPATTSRTYGYHRVEIFAALINGVVLVGTSGAIFFEAYQRFRNPPEVRTSLLLIIAFLGLVDNLASFFILRRASEHTLNVKAAFWHVAGDTLSSVGVIIGGIIIRFTGLNIVDPIIASVIGIIILIGAVQLVRDSTNILLEATPESINPEEVIASIKGVEGVKDLHDLHIWTITSGIYALSAHLMVDDQMVSRGSEILASVNHVLSSKFGISHTTLQAECERCGTCPTGLVCTLQRGILPEEDHEHNASHGH